MNKFSKKKGKQIKINQALFNFCNSLFKKRSYFIFDAYITDNLLIFSSIFASYVSTTSFFEKGVVLFIPVFILSLGVFGV